MNDQQQNDGLVPFLDVIEALKKRDPPLNDWAPAAHSASAWP